MVKKLTQVEAVLEALEIIGHQSSLDTLKLKAEEFYGAAIHNTTVYGVRSEWRKANKLVADCRTYSAQPRRNMLNDAYMSLADQLAANKLTQLITNVTAFEELISKFHSVDHLLNCVKKVKRKRKVA